MAAGRCGVAQTAKVPQRRRVKLGMWNTFPEWAQKRFCIERMERIKKWAEPESNRRHQDFQSCALPTELSALTPDESGNRKRGSLMAEISRYNPRSTTFVSRTEGVAIYSLRIAYSGAIRDLFERRSALVRRLPQERASYAGAGSPKQRETSRLWKPACPSRQCFCRQCD